MSFEDDELDREIDAEMGWAKNLKKKEARRDRTRGAVPGLGMLQQLKLSQLIARSLKTIMRRLGKIIFYPLLGPLSYSKRFNVDGDLMLVKRSWQWRLIDGLATRILLTPVILGIFLFAVVYASTHPQRVQATTTPESRGVYFKRVRLVAADGQGLAAWYIPPVTADEMLFDPEAMVAQKWPAVVLCHGLGATHDQYLPLAQELHKAGFAVLMVDTRGQGESDPAAITYGIRERVDVLAGVKYLRELSNIDKGKVCVVGHDIGAEAALQAVSLDSSVAAVVADGMWPRFEERSRNIFAHPGGGNWPTGWFAPLYTLAFEIGIRDRLQDPEGAARNIHTQPVFFVARQGAAYASVQDVMTLATSVGSRHEVIVAEEQGGDTDARVRDFLMQATGWKGPHAKGAEEIQKLLNSRVK